MSLESQYKLSLCITTFNRGTFIGATLESIIVQMTSNCELVVLDGGSTDNTEKVVAEYGQRCDRLRYFRQDTNNGIDKDYDRVVELARGEYCWLMTDDDVLKPGAIAAVLKALRRDLSLVLVNVEWQDIGMTTVLQRSYFDFRADRVYEPGEMDRLLVETGAFLRFIGCVVIKRSIWLERDRERYYGSLFVHVGVIFQSCLPEQTLVVAQPFISYRTANTHTFSPRIFEVDMFNWPSLVWSLPLSDSAKAKVCYAEPWRHLHPLLRYRALGFYSSAEYRRWIRPRLRSIRESFIPTMVALFPGILANALFVFYYSLTGRHRGAWLQGLKESRFHVRNWIGFKHGL